MYGKIFGCTFERSMFGAGPTVFALWSYVIAKTVDSYVDLNPRIIAAILGTTPEDVEKAIEYLCAPDPDSTHSAFEGRRLLKEGQFQYKVPNHSLYRGITSNEQLRESNRERQAKSRQAVKANKASHPEIVGILEFLNQSTGRVFRPTASNIAIINARLNEDDVTIEGVRDMISRQCLCWQGGPMAEYLRPATLFGKEKFDGYYAARSMPIPNVNGANSSQKPNQNLIQEQFEVPVLNFTTNPAPANEHQQLQQSQARPRNELPPNPAGGLSNGCSAPTPGPAPSSSQPPGRPALFL